MLITFLSLKLQISNIAYDAPHKILHNPVPPVTQKILLYDRDACGGHTYTRTHVHTNILTPKTTNFERELRPKQWTDFDEILNLSSPT